jgi:hypothetical protein
VTNVKASRRLSKAALVVLALGVLSILGGAGWLAYQLFVRGHSGMALRTPLLAFEMYAFVGAASLLAVSVLLGRRTWIYPYGGSLGLAAILMLLSWKQDGELAPGIAIPPDFEPFFWIVAILLPLVALLGAGRAAMDFPERLGFGRRPLRT